MQHKVQGKGKTEMKNTSFDAKLLETLSHFPEGLSAGELKSLFPDTRANAVWASLYALKKGDCVRILHERPMPQPSARKSEKVYVATGRAYDDRVRTAHNKKKIIAPSRAAVPRLW